MSFVTESLPPGVKVQLRNEVRNVYRATNVPPVDGVHHVGAHTDPEKTVFVMHSIRKPAEVFQNQRKKELPPEPFTHVFLVYDHETSSWIVDPHMQAHWYAISGAELC
jgi:hypothetical protein